MSCSGDQTQLPVATSGHYSSLVFRHLTMDVDEETLYLLVVLIIGTSTFSVRGLSRIQETDTERNSSVCADQYNCKEIY